MKQINLPNRLSLLRVLLVPVLVACMYIPGTAGCIVSLIIFSGAALTDFFDGYIARKRGIVTNLGKFIDPVADKLLVISAMIMLVNRGMLAAWVVVLVLFRELAIDSLRLVASKNGTVIAASPYGKMKTVIQIITVILLLCTSFFPWLNIIAQAFIWLTIAATLWSGVDYFKKNGHVLFQDEEKNK
jgi:CDP-diacylglycerol--glycerol-3-phosphate 3-phosphatidyltransferase